MDGHHGSWPGELFTTRQALSLGATEKQLTRAVKAGQLRRLAHGAYAAAPRPTTPEGRHRELCCAVLLLLPDAVLAGRSAVVAHGLPQWDLPLSTALVHRPVRAQHRRSGVVIRPVSDDDTPVRTSLGPAQSVEAALVQVAIDHGAPSSVVAADAALARGLVTPDSVATVVEHRRGHPRSQRAVAMTCLMDGRSESPGESRLRVMLSSFGFAVDSQVVIEDGCVVVARADLAIRGSRVLIEFDGLVKYADGGAEALVREKRREDRLRALGYVVLRFTWADLESPARVIAQVRAAVARDAAARRAGA